MKRTAAERCLNALQIAGSKGVANTTLLEPFVGGNRFQARLHELRDQGYEIECRRESAGRTRYFLRDDVGVGASLPPRSPAGSHPSVISSSDDHAPHEAKRAVTSDVDAHGETGGSQNRGLRAAKSEGGTPGPSEALTISYPGPGGSLRLPPVRDEQERAERSFDLIFAAEKAVLGDRSLEWADQHSQERLAA